MYIAYYHFPLEPIHDQLMIYVLIVLIETYITFKIMNLITSLVFTVVWYGYTGKHF